MVISISQPQVDSATNNFIQEFKDFDRNKAVTAKILESFTLSKDYLNFYTRNQILSKDFARIENNETTFFCHLLNRKENITGLNVYQAKVIYNKPGKKLPIKLLIQEILYKIPNLLSDYIFTQQGKDFWELVCKVADRRKYHFYLINTRTDSFFKTTISKIFERDYWGDNSSFKQHQILIRHSAFTGDELKQKSFSHNGNLSNSHNVKDVYVQNSKKSDCFPIFL